MSHLEQFFQQLVANLAAIDPGRLHRQVQLSEIQRDIMPYRTNRRALALESAEDYEVLLLRLCAGEGGFARTDPPELQTRFESELGTGNPDLSLLRVHGDALVSLASSAVARALADPLASYAPPAAPPPAPVETFGRALDDTATIEEPVEPVAPEYPTESEETVPHCAYCGGALPAGRQVNFCPHCGQSQTTLHCPACQAEIELGWRHCVSCGAPLDEP